MLLDTLIGFAIAVGILILASYLLTSLIGFYQALFDNYLKDKIARPDLISVYARFAAVATLALVLVLTLSVSMGFPGQGHSF